MKMPAAVLTSLILGLGPAAEAAAGQKIVSFSEGSSAAARAAAVETLGGRLIRDLGFINAAVAEFPEFPVSPSKSAGGAAGTPGIVAGVKDDFWVVWDLSSPAPREWPEVPLLDPISEGAGAAGTVPEVPAPPEAVAKGFFSDLFMNDPEIPWGVKDIEAYKVWKYNTGEGVKVAVLDSGIDFDHPDLRENIAGGFNVLKPGEPPADKYFHGTHVAGTIVAVRDGKGVAGVAPKAKLYAVKFYEDRYGGPFSALLGAIGWAVENRMQVINLSVGTPSDVPELRLAVEAALETGITVVAAAGNDYGRRLLYPAAYPGVIAVTASYKKESLAGFSNRGPEVSFIAPGSYIRSTYPRGRYGEEYGTSTACPHVAGLAALAVKAGASGPGEVKAMLAKAAAPLKGLSRDEQGAGFINATLLPRPPK